MVQTQKYLKIQSNLDVNVTGGLDALDMTDVNSNIGDKLKVQALWPKTVVLIKKGVSYYPAEIKEWKTVQSLEKHGTFTISGEVIGLPDNLSEEEIEFIKSNFEGLNEGKREVKRQKEELGKVKKEAKETKPTLTNINLEV